MWCRIKEQLRDSILLNRAKMLNINQEGIIFKPGVHVGVAEDDLLYKAIILSVDWPNTQVNVHFVNFNKRYDRYVNMSEVLEWRMETGNQNEHKRPLSSE